MFRRLWPYRTRPEGDPDVALTMRRSMQLVLIAVVVLIGVVGPIVLIVQYLSDDSEFSAGTIVFGSAVFLLASAYMISAMIRPFYEVFGAEVWKRRRRVADLREVDHARVKFGTWDRDVGVQLTRRDDGGRIMLRFVERAPDDEQRQLHGVLVANGVDVLDQWTFPDGSVIEPSVGAKPN